MKESAEDCLFEDSSENTNLGRFLWHCSEQESNCWKLFVRKTCVKSEAGRQEGEDGKFFGLFPSFFLSSPKWLLQKPFKREIVVRPRFQLSSTMNGMKRVSVADLLRKKSPKIINWTKKLGQMWKCSGVYLVVADSSLWKFAPAVNFLLEGEPRPRWKRGNSPLFLLLTAFNPAI